MSALPKVLFVCTYRGGRSQIAYAYANKHAQGVFESECACFDPGTISKEFVEFVGGLDLEIKRESPKSVFGIHRENARFDYIVCLCEASSGEMCSLFHLNIKSIFPDCIERLHWSISDFSRCAHAPEGFEACVKGVCKEIEQNVIALTERLRSR